MSAEKRKAQVSTDVASCYRSRHPGKPPRSGPQHLPRLGSVPRAMRLRMLEANANVFGCKAPTIPGARLSQMEKMRRQLPPPPISTHDHGFALILARRCPANGSKRGLESATPCPWGQVQHPIQVLPWQCISTSRHPKARESSI